MSLFLDVRGFKSKNIIANHDKLMDMCKNVEIIKARISDPPDLFLGGNLVKDDGQDDYELPRNLGLSILPNSNNAVFLGDSLIISEPGQNSAFARLLLKIFQT